jgi:hypothetical protein
MNRSDGDSMEVSGTSDLGSIPSGATKTFSMFYAYVLKSINQDYFYKGHCANLQKRLAGNKPPAQNIHASEWN